MGHIRLGVLPKHPRWKDVIGMLEDNEVPASEIGLKVLDNSIDVLTSESTHSTISYCIWLMTQLTLAARGQDFVASLAQIGIQITRNVSGAEFVAKTSQTATRKLSSLPHYSALNKMAGLALREALTKTVGAQTKTLFGTDLSDVQLALKKYSTQKQFSDLLQIYFSAYLRRTLRFIVDKEITNHVGTGRRFENIQQMEEFDTALELFANQTSRIVYDFSGGWYSKKAWQQGAILEIDVDGFVYVALNKLREDLNMNEVQ